MPLGPRLHTASAMAVPTIIWTLHDETWSGTLEDLPPLSADQIAHLSKASNSYRDALNQMFIERPMAEGQGNPVFQLHDVSFASSLPETQSGTTSHMPESSDMEMNHELSNPITEQQAYESTAEGCELNTWENLPYSTFSDPKSHQSDELNLFNQVDFTPEFVDGQKIETTSSSSVDMLTNEQDMDSASSKRIEYDSTIGSNHYGFVNPRDVRVTFDSGVDTRQSDHSAAEVRVKFQAQIQNLTAERCRRSSPEAWSLSLASAKYLNNETQVLGPNAQLGTLEQAGHRHGTEYEYANVPDNTNTILGQDEGMLRVAEYVYERLTPSTWDFDNQIPAYQGDGAVTSQNTDLPSEHDSEQSLLEATPSAKTVNTMAAEENSSHDDNSSVGETYTIQGSHTPGNGEEPEDDAEIVPVHVGSWKAKSERSSPEIKIETETDEEMTIYETARQHWKSEETRTRTPEPRDNGESGGPSEVRPITFLPTASELAVVDMADVPIVSNWHWHFGGPSNCRPAWSLWTLRGRSEPTFSSRSASLSKHDVGREVEMSG